MKKYSRFPWIILFFVLVASIPFAGCKKKYKPDLSTPLSAVQSYIWAVNHHDCRVLESIVSGRFKRFLEKRGKEGCYSIMKAYALSREKRRIADIRVEAIGEPLLVHEDDARALVALQLTRNDREEVAYFDLEHTEKGWQVVGEMPQLPRWYTGPAPQFSRPDVQPESGKPEGVAAPAAPSPPVENAPPAPTPPVENASPAPTPPVESAPPAPTPPVESAPPASPPDDSPEPVPMESAAPEEPQP